MQERTRTFAFLDVVARSRLCVGARNARDLEHQHETVEQTMHDLESGGFVAPYCSGVAGVACLSLK